jgi:hypothetical protein
MSELDTIDPESLTRSQAASLFQSKVEEYQRTTGVTDFIVAWARTRDMNPKLFSRMGVHDEPPNPANVQSAGRYADSSGLIKGPTPASPYVGGRSGQASSLAAKLMPRRAVSLPNEANIDALGLPRDCSYEEFRAADRANGGASPRNSPAIVEALVNLMVQRGMTLDGARAAARDRYPLLHTEANGQATQA